MSEKKIQIPVNKVRINNQGVVRLDNEALAAVSSIAVKTGWSTKKTVSMIIKQAVENDLIEIKEDTE